MTVAWRFRDGWSIVEFSQICCRLRPKSIFPFVIKVSHFYRYRMFGYNPLRLRLDPSSKGTFTSIVTPQTADLMGNV